MKSIREMVFDYGPAIFMIGAVLGTGSVSSLVVAGAEHGMSLLWALLLSCVFFWVLLASISRLTFASGKTFVTLTKEQFGAVPALYVVVAVVVSQFTSNIGVLGIVSEAFASWANVDILASSVFWCSAVYLLIFFGKHAVFERALAFFVSVLGLSFLLNMFLARPSASVVLAGLVPQVPDGGAMIVGAMVGTTLAGPVIVMRSFVVKDKGWTIDNLKLANRDAVVSGLLVFFVSAAVMACAAATLHVRGLHVDNAMDMAYTLVPLLGHFAATMFVVGIMAAGLSSAFTNALVSIWTISEFSGLSRDPRALHFRLLAILFCGAGLIAPVFGGKPVFLQIISLGVQVIFLPLLVLIILILVNRESVAGRFRNSTAFNVMGIITFMFSLFMAYQAVMGLSEVLARFLHQGAS